MEMKPKPQVRPKLKRPNFFDEIVRTIIFVIVVTVLFDMAIPRSLVDGSSMEPTFSNSERLIVSRVHYLAMRPERGDVIVFNAISPPKSDIMLIKRVIGVPGDTVEWRNQQLYVNDVLIDEDYILESCSTSRCSDNTWSLGTDEYFVMGDNRNHSNDSRSFGSVPIDHIVGRVVFRYWPIPRVGMINHVDYDELDQ